MLRAVAAAAPTVWVDTSGDALAAVRDGFPAAGLKVNLAEARALLDGEVGSDHGDRGADRRSGARALAAAEALSGGVRRVVVTAGERAQPRRGAGSR